MSYPVLVTYSLIRLWGGFFVGKNKSVADSYMEMD